MAGRLLVVPFATAGDRAAVPDPLQPSGSVSFTTGFTPDYELPNTDPDYKPVPRDQTNELYHILTENMGIAQKQGASDWFDPGVTGYNYGLNARVFHDDKLWRSNTAGNAGEPGVAATWDDVSTSAPDYLNTLRIDVASAASVDLAALAPDTRNIRLTGAATINGFVIPAGQLYFVTFGGASVLTNSAGLTTNRGVNIQCAAGDTCVLRATAANTVEVLCFVPALRNLVFETYYSPVDLTWVSGGPVGPFAHGMSGAHMLAILELTCIAPDSGYPAGHVLQIVQGYSFQAADGMAITSDATTYTGRWASTRIASALNWTSGAAANLGSANWRGRVRLLRWSLPA